MNRTDTDEVTRGTMEEYARSGCSHVPQADRRGEDQFVCVCQEVRGSEGDAATEE
jgi:hypothetical protein